MGLFDIFRKKKTNNTFPENELEKVFKEATTNVEARDAFYMKLLWNDLYVITNESNAFQEGAQILEENVSLELQTFENGYIPVFTSANRIFDKGIVKEKVPYVAMKGQDLFKITKGANLILNPYSEYHKELVVDEIEMLLNGTLFNDSHEKENSEDSKKINEFNQLYDQAINLQKGLLLLDGYRYKDINVSEKKKLEASIVAFKKCLEIFPDHWQSMMLMAKSYQRLQKHLEAFNILEKAFTIELTNHSIPMEASLEAMHLENIEKALYYSEASLKRKPNDFVLLGNHAMNLLIASKDEEAKEIIKQAISLQPRDSINKNIQSTIHDVITGKRKRPTFKDAIK
ncbi:SseB family protein [Kordia sp.]|uniref:SseB family protein n=1 Tax=Kordia sp. TaxID=1965332 RepID=UPI003D2C0A2B